jgi:hypothetical protein
MKLNDFAPYPEREEDATADCMARNFAVLGHANHCRMLDGADDTERHEAVALVVSSYGFVYLLREFAAVDKDRADAAARDLWSAWDAGDSLGEWLWEWLKSDYGIDPEAVTCVAEEMLAKPQGKSMRAALAEAEADRDRARDAAVALEQENARLTEDRELANRIDKSTLAEVTNARDAVYEGRSGEAVDILSDLLESLR